MARLSDALIQTERLDLRLIAVPDLITLYETPDDPALWAGHPYVNPHRVLMDEPGPLRWRVPSVRQDPAVNRWLVRFIVLRATREVIGYIGFHDAPDLSGMLEVGVLVHPEFRGQGYASEALAGMWGWAVAQTPVRTLRYTVSPDNTPSVAIVQRFGFTHVGQQIDEIDGPEDIYEMGAEEYQQKHAVAGPVD